MAASSSAGHCQTALTHIAKHSRMWVTIPIVTPPVTIGIVTHILLSGVLLPAPSVTEDGEQNLQQDEQYDDDLQEFGAIRVRLIGDYPVHSLGHVQLPLDAFLP